MLIDVPFVFKNSKDERRSSSAVLNNLDGTGISWKRQIGTNLVTYAQRVYKTVPYSI